MIELSVETAAWISVGTGVISYAFGAWTGHAITRHIWQDHLDEVQDSHDEQCRNLKANYRRERDTTLSAIGKDISEVCTKHKIVLPINANGETADQFKQRLQAKHLNGKSPLQANYEKAVGTQNAQTVT